MKRKLFLAAMLIGAGTIAFAQTTPVTNKNGLTVTPEAGDWALGMNAAPLLNFVGNMFNGTAGNSVNTGFVAGNPLSNSGAGIYGKYFIDENTAYRGTFRVTSLNGSASNMIDTAGSTPQYPSGYVTNVTKTSGFGFVLGGGIEKRKGHGRIQGYYGGEVLLSFGGTAPNTSTEFGLALDSASINDYPTAAANGRTLSTKAGSSFGFGVRGFVGVEYFVAPKLSIGGEFGWGLTYVTTSEGEVVKEYYGNDGVATANSVFTRTTTTGKSSAFNLNTDNLGGVIRVMFHF
jgi:hypothetical protein